MDLAILEINVKTL